MLIHKRNPAAAPIAVELNDLNVFNVTSLSWTALTTRATGPRPPRLDSVVFAAVGNVIVLSLGWNVFSSEPALALQPLLEWYVNRGKGRYMHPSIGAGFMTATSM